MVEQTFSILATYGMQTLVIWSPMLWTLLIPYNQLLVTQV